MLTIKQLFTTINTANEHTIYNNAILLHVFHYYCTFFLSPSFASLS